jgi:hypothetical protein
MKRISKKKKKKNKEKKQGKKQLQKTNLDGKIIAAREIGDNVLQNRPHDRIVARLAQIQTPR